MNNQKERPETIAKLRREAEKILLEKEFGLPEDFETLSSEEIRAALHDLRVHQIELEMQNEELRRAQLELAVSRASYFDLYDLAPIGYMTLSDNGIIRKVNLTATIMLGVKRVDLSARLFSHFIFKEDQDIFYLLRKQMAKTTETQVCELRMQKKDGTLFWARLQATAVLAEGYESAENKSPSIIKIVLVDISERMEKEQALREMKWRLESIIKGTQAGTWEWNVQTGEVIFNEVWARIVGYTLDELAPTNIELLVRLTHPDDRKRWYELMESHFAGELSDINHESRMKHKEGYWVWVNIRGRVITRTAKGKPEMVFGTYIDITPRKMAEKAYMESNERFNNLFEKHDSVMLLVEAQTGSIIDANRAAEKFYGYNKSQFRAMTISDINMLPYEQVVDEMHSALTENLNTFVFPHKLANGEEKTVEVHSTPIMFNDRKVLFSIIHDITDRKRIEEKLKLVYNELQNAVVREQQLARSDVLTGVNNRRHLLELAAQNYEVAVRYHQPLSICLFDLDFFKNINDTFGHAVGDLVLQRVTQIASEEIRSTDVIGRYGGEEFVIIMPMTTANQAYLLAERIRAKVELTRIPTETGDAAVTISIGIFEMNNESQAKSVDAMINRADMAMYRSKQAGRNRTKIDGE